MAKHYTFKISEEAEQEIDAAMAHFREVCKGHGVPCYAIAVTRADRDSTHNYVGLNLGRPVHINGEKLTPLPSPEMVSVMVAYATHSAVDKGQKLSVVNRQLLDISRPLIFAAHRSTVSLDWMSRGTFTA